MKTETEQVLLQIHRAVKESLAVQLYESSLRFVRQVDNPDWRRANDEVKSFFLGLASKVMEGDPQEADSLPIEEPKE